MYLRVCMELIVKDATLSASFKEVRTSSCQLSPAFLPEDCDVPKHASTSPAPAFSNIPLSQAVQ